MRFRKYHGAGNDFVMLADLDARLGAPATLPLELVAALCDRHTGIGSDGLIRIVSAAGDDEARDAGAAYRMDYYNADGRAAEMCGNGIRCLVMHEVREGRLPQGQHRVLTGAGAVTVQTVDRGRVTVDMGAPSLEREVVPMVGRGPSVRAEVDLDGWTIRGTGVSMGNPHFVVFASDIGRGLVDELVLQTGRALETHPDFPQRTNVEFVEVVDATRLRVRVWERGVGETMACGSGACAVAVASAALERTGPHVIVEMPGGELEVEWEPSGSVWLSGPAEEVFAGELDAGWLRARGLEAYVTLVGAT